MLVENEKTYKSLYLLPKFIFLNVYWLWFCVFTLEGAIHTDHQHSQNKYFILSFQSAAIKTFCW